MKIDTDEMGVFFGTVNVDDANSWLNGDIPDLSVDINEAIDEATSFAKANGKAFVLIEIARTDD